MAPFPAAFPRSRPCATKGSDAVSVNNAPVFKNSKSGLRCANQCLKLCVYRRQLY